MPQRPDGDVAARIGARHLYATTFQSFRAPACTAPGSRPGYVQGGDESAPAHELEEALVFEGLHPMPVVIWRQIADLELEEGTVDLATAGYVPPTRRNVSRGRA